jgi:hypothetical protein
MFVINYNGIIVWSGIGFLGILLIGALLVLNSA